MAQRHLSVGSHIKKQYCLIASIHPECQHSRYDIATHKGRYCRKHDHRATQTAVSQNAHRIRTDHLFIGRNKGCPSKRFTGIAHEQMYHCHIGCDHKFFHIRSLHTCPTQ